MSNIVENRAAFHEYFIEDRYEAGLILLGWEVKSIRAGRANVKEAYVKILNGKIALVGAHISALPEASKHVIPDPTRTRSLLLHKNEIAKLIGKVERAGYTLVPLNLHFTNGRVKCEIGLAKGKNKADKRASEKDQDGKREVAQAMKQNLR